MISPLLSIITGMIKQGSCFSRSTWCGRRFLAGRRPFFLVRARPRLITRGVRGLARSRPRHAAHDRHRRRRRQQPVAVRDFDWAHVGSGSCAPDRYVAGGLAMSASPPIATELILCREMTPPRAAANSHFTGLPHRRWRAADETRWDQAP